MKKRRLAEEIQEGFDSLAESRANPIVKVVLYFDPGTPEPNLDLLTDGIIDLLTKQYPNHSGTGMSVGLTNENGD